MIVCDIIEQVTPQLLSHKSTKTFTLQKVKDTKDYNVRIDNFSPLELQAQERESNPEPGFPRAAGPEDRKTNRPHFSGIKPLQADVEEDNPPRKVD
ncbi:hypothetical protein DSO57_1006891 [Entomophthora muscae]|uniref:Uncharacterized protein n=1 Tax=Entomophthora muscae TaxID=34485 RepID=A0ACC2T7W7_9FUNG|nr:hypothetical protein DSO57_1006891 [Entomophthora muscae]